jgi:hypothetical protein
MSETERATGKTVTCQLFQREEATSRRILYETPLHYTRRNKRFSQAISSYRCRFHGHLDHSVFSGVEVHHGRGEASRRHLGPLRYRGPDTHGQRGSAQARLTAQDQVGTRQEIAVVRATGATDG